METPLPSPVPGQYSLFPRKPVLWVQCRSPAPLPNPKPLCPSASAKLHLMLFAARFQVCYRQHPAQQTLCLLSAVCMCSSGSQNNCNGFESRGNILVQTPGRGELQPTCDAVLTQAGEVKAAAHRPNTRKRVWLQGPGRACLLPRKGSCQRFPLVIWSESQLLLPCFHQI